MKTPSVRSFRLPIMVSIGTAFGTVTLTLSSLLLSLAKSYFGTPFCTLSMTSLSSYYRSSITPWVLPIATSMKHFVLYSISPKSRAASTIYLILYSTGAKSFIRKIRISLAKQLTASATTTSSSPTTPLKNDTFSQVPSSSHVPF
jgi:hypothetical protein